MYIIGTCACGCEIDNDDFYIEIGNRNYICSWNCSKLFLEKYFNVKEVN